MNDSENEFNKSMREAEEALKSIDRRAEKFSDDITKYFDRINDKLFNLNNIYIAAYFALVAFKPSAPKYILVFPLGNSILMLYIDWLMMEAMRRMSNSKNMTLTQIKKENEKLSIINLIAFLPIFTTLILTGLLFGYVLYYI